MSDNPTPETPAPHEQKPDVEHGQTVLDGIVADLEGITERFARVLSRLGEASERGLGERLAGLPLDQFVALHAHVPAWETRRLVGAAELLADLPWLSARVAAGEVAWSSLSLLTVQLGRLNAEARRWIDATIEANHDPAERVDPDRLVDAVNTLIDQASPRTARQREQRDIETAFIGLQHSFDGRSRLLGELDAVTTALFDAAAEHAGRVPGDRATTVTDHASDDTGSDGDPVTGQGRSRAQRRADGLRTMATAWLAGHRHTLDDPAHDGHDDDHDGHATAATDSGETHGVPSAEGDGTPNGDGAPHTGNEFGSTTDDPVGAARGGAGFPVLPDGCGCGQGLKPALPSVLVSTDIVHLTAALTGGRAPAGEAVAAAAAQLLTGGSRPVSLTPTALEWLACDATLTPILTDGTTVLGTAAPVETIADELRAALIARDRGCRFPGCGRGPSQCHAHHVVYRRDLGPTLLENLVLLCGHHHRLVHYRGWTLTLHPDGTLDARYRRQTFTTRPRTKELTLAAGPPPRRRRRRTPPIPTATAAGPLGDTASDSPTTRRRPPPSPPPDVPF